MPHLEIWQWLVGALCAMCVGVAKTGLPGFGILVVPLIILTVGDARASAAWLLPLLCTADLFAVIYWRRHAAAGRLFSLVPWVLIGMAGGALALNLKETVLRPIVGSIVLVMLIAYLWRKYAKNGASVTPHPVVYGATAGFATTVANAAGPVMSLYLLSKNLPKEEFIATGAWFFFIINLTKVPIYAWHGLFSRQSLTFDVLMVPAVMVGAMGGRRLVPHIPEKLFEALVVILTAASTLFLFR
ncbi:sulfite exporter TauE/SafE family protein [Paludibaculum fermentans]|uniref:sulfite exporter TauE/SafE family protein n=1 Tax=Paludibaculum fermentans TaxID=1473598 RepID=UPI003EB8613E